MFDWNQIEGFFARLGLTLILGAVCLWLFGGVFQVEFLGWIASILVLAAVGCAAAVGFILIWKDSPWW